MSYAVLQQVQAEHADLLVLTEVAEPDAGERLHLLEVGPAVGRKREVPDGKADKAIVANVGQAGLRRQVAARDKGVGSGPI